MNLSKFIRAENILTQVVVSSRDELFHLQAESIYQALPMRYREGVSPDSLYAAVQEREARQSTALGDGVAIPHARIPGFQHLGFSLALLREPLEYGAEDPQPVRISLMVIAAQENPNVVIRIWAAVMRVLRDPDVRRILVEAASPAEVLSLLRACDMETEASMVAEDLMVKPLFDILPDTPVSEITYQMFQHKEIASAVVDEQGNLVGEITSDAIFQYGMPDFFTQLQSVSFIRHFNPLEKYFENEARMVARDVMTRDFSAVRPQSTLVEVIFELCVKRRSKVYVVNESGRLAGVIGRLTVLDRAINF